MRTFNRLNLYLAILLGCLVVMAGSFYMSPYLKSEQALIIISPLQEHVLGASTSVINLVQPLVQEPIPTIPIKHYPTPAKSDYTIAMIGDSMVDTAGERLEYLEHALRARYPRTNFHLYNYGRGSQTAGDGLRRFDDAFVNQDRNYPPLSSIHPDIIILGSYAYNPYSPPDVGRHHADLSEMVSRCLAITPHVYLLAEIAPIRNEFGTGPQGVNWDPNTAYEHTAKILDQLDDTIALAHERNIPIINVFGATIATSDRSGKETYVNPVDHIHPSVAGHTFMANFIADILNFK